MTKSKEELISMIENDLVDPSTNKITGERVKNALTEMVDAMGEGGGGAAMEYWKVPELYKEHLDLAPLFFVLAKCFVFDSINIVPGGFAYQNGAAVDAFAYIPTLKTHIMGVESTAAEVLANEFLIDLVTMGFTPMTEDEFYAI